MTDSLLDTPCKSTAQRNVLLKVWRCWLSALVWSVLLLIVLPLQFVTHPGVFILAARLILWRTVTKNTLLLLDLLKSVHSQPHLWGTIFFLQHPQWSLQGDRAVINTVQRRVYFYCHESHAQIDVYIFTRRLCDNQPLSGSLWTKKLLDLNEIFRKCCQWAKEQIMKVTFQILEGLWPITFDISWRLWSWSKPTTVCYVTL